MPTSKPKAREDIDMVELQGERIIFDSQTGKVHYLNPTAALVFQLCDGTGTVQELSSDVAEVYALPPDEVLGQVDDIVEAFRQAGLLAGSLPLVNALEERRGPMAGDHVPARDRTAHEHNHADDDDPHDQGHAGMDPGHEVDARELIEEQEPRST